MKAVQKQLPIHINSSRVITAKTSWEGEFLDINLYFSQILHSQHLIGVQLLLVHHFRRFKVLQTFEYKELVVTSVYHKIRTLYSFVVPVVGLNSASYTKAWGIRFNHHHLTDLDVSQNLMLSSSPQNGLPQLKEQNLFVGREENSGKDTASWELQKITTLPSSLTCSCISVRGNLCRFTEIVFNLHPTKFYNLTRNSKRLVCRQSFRSEFMRCIRLESVHGATNSKVMTFGSQQNFSRFGQSSRKQTQ